MTGYHIRLGYNPTRSDYESMWETLKAEALRIASQPQDIVAEARRLGSPENCPDGCCPLETYADNYAWPLDRPGHPLKVIEDGEEPQEWQIMQLASTDTGIKYHVRRAFVRLLIEAAHRHGIEVSVTVA